jgi:hypothetical protein
MTIETSTDAQGDLPDIVGVVMEMGAAPEEPATDAEALRHGSQPLGRSPSFERSTGPSDTPEGVADAHRSEFGKRSQAHRWLSAGDADPSSPPPPAIADSRLPVHRPHTIRIACPPYSGRPDYSWTRT